MREYVRNDVGRPERGRTVVWTSRIEAYVMREDVRNDVGFPVQCRTCGVGDGGNTEALRARRVKLVLPDAARST